MQEQLRIAIIQSDLVWENPKQNRKNFTEKIESIPKANASLPVIIIC